MAGSLLALAALTAACGGNNGSSANASPGGPDAATALFTDTLSIIDVAPRDRAVQVSVDAVITTEFDGPIAQECVEEPDTFLRSETSSAPLAGNFAFRDGGRVLEFTPALPLQPETNYILQFSPLTCTEDGRLLEETRTFTFRTVDNAPPAWLGANVAENATDVARDAEITIDFDEDLAPESANANTVFLRDLFGGDHPVDSLVDERQLRITPTANLPGDRSFVLVIAAVTDRAGNPFEGQRSIRFRTAADTIRPSLLAIWPQEEALSVSPLIRPTLQFDDAMDPFSIETASVVFRDQFANLVPYTVQTSPDRSHLRLIPEKPLDAGRSYSVRALSGPGGVTDVSGNALAAPALIVFDVGNDATAPRITSSDPREGATSISPNAELRLRFDDSLDPSRVNSDNIILTAANGASIDVANSLEINGTELVLSPQSTLAPSTSYTVSLTGGDEGIRDDAGNPLDPLGLTTVTFSTSADATLPRLTVFPVDGSSAVSSNTVISVVADEPLQPATVSASTVYLQRNGGAIVPGTVQILQSDRVIRFVPQAALTQGSTYTLTILGGQLGLREASGNWMQTAFTSQFRVSTRSDDVLPPTVVATLNAIDTPRNGDLSVPPWGFAFTVWSLDADTFNQDMTSTAIVLDGPDSRTPTELFATAEVDSTSLTYRVPSDRALESGSYALYATVTDLSGNVGRSETINFTVSAASAVELPFEKTQAVWVRYDLDRDGNQNADFDDDLLRLGLIAEGDPHGLNERFASIVREGIISRAHLLFRRRANGGRDGQESVAIRFSERQPLGVASMQIACGGFDPEGPPGRVYGDETSGTLGRAFYDYRNQIVNENNTAVSPGVGVFPGELFLFESRVHTNVYPSFVTTFAEAFLPLAPDMGGRPAGSQASDAELLDPNFDYPGTTPSQRARYNTIFGAADQWATAIGTILAHEVGHSIGLVAPGRGSNEMHGDASLHNEFASIFDVMGAAVGYDGLVSLRYSFRDLNLAYLRHRILLK